MYLSSLCCALQPWVGLLSLYMSKVNRCQPQELKKKGTAKVPMLINVDYAIINHHTLKYRRPAGYKLGVWFKGQLQFGRD